MDIFEYSFEPQKTRKSHKILDLDQGDFGPENPKQIVSFSNEVIGRNILMKRNDGRFSSAFVSSINVESQTIKVEWKSRKGSKQVRNLRFEEQGAVFEFLSPEGEISWSQNEKSSESSGKSSSESSSESPSESSSESACESSSEDSRIANDFSKLDLRKEIHSRNPYQYEK